MKKKQIILGVAALVVVAALLFLFGRPPTQSRGADARAGQLVVPGFEPDNARLIEVTKQGADTVRIRKTGDAWSVESSWGYGADASRVNNLLEAIAELRVRDVRSQRPAGYPEFEVDDAAGIWIHVYDAQDATLAFLCAGKTSSYDCAFVRVSGSNDVIAATPNLERNVGAGRERKLDGLHFVDRTVLDFDPADVERITLVRNGLTAVLERIEVEERSVDPETGTETTHTVPKWVIREPATAAEGEAAGESEEAGADAGEAGADAEAAAAHIEDADEAACLALLDDLSHVVAADIAGGKTVFECGLDRSRVMVEFAFSEKAGRGPLALFVGNKVPEEKEDRCYAMTGEEGARIFVIAGYYHDAAARCLDEFRKVKRQKPAEDQVEEAERPADGPADSQGDDMKTGEEAGPAGDTTTPGPDPA